MRFFYRAVVVILVLAGNATAQSSLWALGSQVATTHQLRAPKKAQRAVEDAIADVTRGRPELANEHLSQALAVYPNYSIALTVRALLKLDEGKAEEAFAAARAAVEADPGFAAPYIVLGSLHNRAKHYSDAQVELRNAMQLQPTAWQAHLEMGCALFGNGEDLAALHEVEAAIRLISDRESPEDRARVHFWRAHVLVQLKDLSAAKLEYDQAINAEPHGQFAEYSRQALALLPSLAIGKSTESR